MAGLYFLETDSNEIYKTIITALEESVSEPLYPGDERRIFGDALVSVVVAVFNQANEACKQKMLQYASGEVLDALGARYHCDRIQPVTSKTVFRFSVSVAMQSNIIIPLGTRVTPDNEVYFQTTENAVLQAGDLFVDVPAECTVTGEKYNGYEPGQIKQLVDLIPYIDDVTNTVTTHGGDDGEPYPSEDDGVGDDHYRERIWLAPTALSVAGPSDAYEYYAKSADASIADVAVISDVETLKRTLNVHGGVACIGGRDLYPDSLVIAGTTSEYTTSYSDELLTITFANQADGTLSATINQDMAGKVLIVPILTSGKIPDAEMLKKVADVCSADDVRPMTDLVEVRAPEQMEYDINITYYTTKSNESDCVTTIEGDGGAIAQYKDWQNTKMGRDINPDKLRSLCLAPKEGTGCDRMVITSPVYTEISETQVASFSGNITVNHVVEVD